MSSHTPGPWVVEADCDHDASIVTALSGIEVALVEPAPVLTEGEWQANAQLIAAAPDLLAFARAVAQVAHEGHDPAAALPILADRARTLVWEITGRPWRPAVGRTHIALTARVAELRSALDRIARASYEAEETPATWQDISNRQTAIARAALARADRPIGEA